MKVRLQFKIFVVFSLATLIFVLFMVISLRYFMQRHLTEFVNRLELERLEVLQSFLEEEYRTAGDWRRLQNEPQHWTAIVQASIAAWHADAGEEGPPGHEPGPPPPGGRLAPGPEALSGARRDERPRGGRRLFLLDAAKEHVAGRPDASGDTILQPITVQGEVVGWLGLKKRRTLRTPLELAFLQQQYALFYLLGGGLLLISALASFLLARHVLAPVKKLTAGTRALTSRRFDTRIQVSSKDELGQLAGDFNHMAQTLQTYEQLQRQWMSDIAHELRTPLSVLRGEIEAMQDGVRTVTPERLASLHAEVLGLHQLVEDLHQLSLAESGALNFAREPVDPLAVLAKCLQTFETRLAAKGIGVTADLNHAQRPIIMGDAGRLGQLFNNVLENTVRYVQAPGRLTIRQQTDQDHWTLVLEDSGPGVPEEALAHLFDRLYRVDQSRSRAFGGSGLGLSICKSIVETMGGAMRAANAPGAGLRLTVVLPLSPGSPKRNHRK